MVTKPLSNERGIAMMIALFAMMLMTFIAVEVSYDTNVEYIVSSQEVNQLKAYYAARSGVELALLRINLYKKASSLLEEKAKGAIPVTMLDPIWKFPFAWPPSQYLPEDINISAVDRDTIKKLEKESLMDTTYQITIENEGSKLDINDLASPSEGLAKSMRAQISQIFEQEKENNDEFREKYSSFDFERLINNITDWIDEDQESLNGGSEASFYPDINNEFVPPNESFKTLEELHMVADMTDDIFNLLAKRVTVYGVKGVNVNHASKEVLMALDPQITDEVASEIIARRDDPEKGGPFGDENNFKEFVASLGVNLNTFNQSKVPLLFDAVYNFRVVATGQFSNVNKTITVVTYDTESVGVRLAQTLETETKKEGEGDKSGDSGGEGGDTGGDKSGDGDDKGGGDDQDGPSGDKTTTGPTANQTKPKLGPPNVVYWKEN